MEARSVDDVLAEARSGGQGGGVPCWSSLRERVEAHLVRGGLPAALALRASHEIVVRCAREADAVDGLPVAEHALGEAETALAGWRASHRA